MKNFTLILFLALFFGCKSKEKVEEKKEKNNYISFYVGTYTGKESKGIYKYTLQKDGLLKEIGLVAETENPSFLTKANDGKTLLAVNETNYDGTGSIESYSIKNDSLILINQSKTGGEHPCFVAVNKDGFVVTANYTGGNVGLLRVEKNGKLSDLLDVQQHSGKGTTERQEAPHAHSVWFHPTKKEIISVDLGTNQLWFSTIDENQNKLIFSEPKTMDLEIGAGPRHLGFHPNNKWIYVLNELNNTVSFLKTESKNYVIDSSISTLPEDFTAFSKAADIHISNDGKFLYASNRGHESIAIFKINQENGKLQSDGYQSVLGKSPRNFSLSPDNNFLIVANQDSDNIVSFKRDSLTGKLEFINEIYAPKPVCILF